MLKLNPVPLALIDSLITVQDNTMLKLEDLIKIGKIGLITVQDNTMLKPVDTREKDKGSLITVQDNTMLKP